MGRLLAGPSHPCISTDACCRNGTEAVAQTGLCVQGTTAGCADPPRRAFRQRLAEKRRIYRRFSSHLDSEAARVVIEPQTDRRRFIFDLP
jgi:hypothetical protein